MADINNDDSLRLNLDEETRRRDADRGVKDDGHTSGGGSLGHDQPADVRRDTPLRNAKEREAKRPSGKNATGTDADPVMPQDDATLKTKI
jgi:hypothetical protein